MAVKPVLHGDNGATLKAAPVLAMLHWPGFEPSYSRPRVSDDNPHAWALIWSAKYRSEFPVKVFVDLGAARDWVGCRNVAPNAVSPSSMAYFVSRNRSARQTCHWPASPR